MNKRKKMVVDHALALFSEKGIQQTSIQDIIERAGVSKGSFYNYFSSKNECVSAILEQARSEASINRSLLLVGKDRNDINVLLEQITLLTQMSIDRGLSAVFEEILHSGDIELKKLVIKFRLFEYEWLADRLIDVFGEELRPFAFEASIIFFGIQQNLTFTSKIIHQTDLDWNKVSRTVFHYLKFIIHGLIHKETSLLDSDKLDVLKVRLKLDEVRHAELLILMDELVEGAQLTRSQTELTGALRYELEQDKLRESVIIALLQPFVESYRSSALYDQAKEIVSVTLLYIKQSK